MGYFSNGSEGDSYYEHYCSRCVHDKPEAEMCPVWTLHLQHNYDECNKPESILHKLIPHDERGGNKQCLMFIEKN